MNISTLQRENDETSVETIESASFLSPGTRLFLSFWLFGTLIAMQFSVVVTAANDLVADRAPTGLILFAYTLPSVLVRTLVPFISFPDISAYLPTSFHRDNSTASGRLLNRLYRARANGEEANKFYSTTLDSSSSLTRSSAESTAPIQAKKVNSLTKHVNYPLRLAICVLSSFFGLQLLAWADHVGVRLLGIAMASLSSNLGDMSFLQLCSRYPKFIGSASAFGGYTTGGGSAALVGAFIYTFSTSTLRFSPSTTISIIGLFPITLIFTYAFLLPRPADAGQVEVVESVEDTKEEGISGLSIKSKLRIASPMFWRYMAPLAAIMLVENSIVQGVLPTLLFYLPFRPSTTPFTGLLNSTFRATRDFYPVYVTVYQFCVFIGRSSISLFRLPNSPIISWGLVMAELVILSFQVSESLSMAAKNDSTGVLYGPLVVLCLAGFMGLCGGLAFSDIYWKVNNSVLPKGVWDALERASSERSRSGDRGSGYMRVRPTDELDDVSLHTQQRVVIQEFESREDNSAIQENEDAEKDMAMREFLLSAIAPPDTFAILLASVVGMKVQPALCGAQVARGRELCRKTRE